MALAEISGIDWESSRTPQAVLAVLVLVLSGLIFYNFFWSPELKRQRQIAVRIEQIQNGLLQAKKNEPRIQIANSGRSPEDREAKLEQLLPTQWKRAELLRRLTENIQQNNLKFETQTLEESEPQALYQALKIRLKISGEYENFQQFLSGLKQNLRLLVLEEIQIENASPGDSEPKLRIEMLLSAYKRLTPPTTKSL